MPAAFRTLLIPLLLLAGLDGTLAAVVQSPPQLDVEQACISISNKLSSVSFEECASLKLQSSGHYSVKNFPILVREFPPLPPKIPRGRVLLLGGTHGDELASISVVFKWLDILQRHHSGLFHWRISPLMNPDGALPRKHRRVNARGVDLNRNFLTPGQQDAAMQYWIHHNHRNKRRYPGETPLSEPETRWLKQEIEDFKPDVIISVHAPHNLVDYDAARRDNAPRRIGYLHKNLLGTYPGSLGNYAGEHLGIPVITLELRHAGIMPTPKQIDRLWTDLVRWLIRNLPASA